MKETTLTKLYKKHSDIGSLKSHRFIHGKRWDAKLLEKCLMKIMEDQVNEHTPEGKVGGMRGQLTRDHIITAVCLARANEKLKKPTIVSLIDLRACFDKIRMADVFYDLAVSNIDLKALKIAHDFSKETIIRIAGDPDTSRKAPIEESCGQGNSIACKGSSLTVGKITDEAIPIENCDGINDAVVPGRDFVDDVFLANKNTDAARSNGELLSKAFEVVALEANPAKSAVIVMGDDEVVEQTRQEL